MKPKFQLSNIFPIVITLVIVGVAVAFGLNVMGDVAGDECVANGGYYNEASAGCQVSASNTTLLGAGYTTTFNATQNGITGLAKIPDKLPLIATVIIAAIVIGILVRYLVM